LDEEFLSGLYNLILQCPDHLFILRQNALLNIHNDFFLIEEKKGFVHYPKLSLDFTVLLEVFLRFFGAVAFMVVKPDPEVLAPAVVLASDFLHFRLVFSPADVVVLRG